MGEEQNTGNGSKTDARITHWDRWSIIGLVSVSAAALGLHFVAPSITFDTPAIILFAFLTFPLWGRFVSFIAIGSDSTIDTDRLIRTLDSFEFVDTDSGQRMVMRVVSRSANHGKNPRAIEAFRKDLQKADRTIEVLRIKVLELLKLHGIDAPSDATLGELNNTYLYSWNGQTPSVIYGEIAHVNHKLRHTRRDPNSVNAARKAAKHHLLPALDRMIQQAGETR